MSESGTNKIHLKVRRSQNNWFEHYKYSHKDIEKGRMEDAEYVLQLCGDARKWDWFWIEQAANKSGLPDFMEHFTKVLAFAEKNETPLFSLYIKK